MSTNGLSNPKHIVRALAKQSYREQRIRLVDPDLAGFSHIVSTRAGLFAVAPSGSKQLCFGMFFGLVSHPDALYVFESCDLPRERTTMGRILRFDKTGTTLSNGRILVEGLDNGCHQMDLIDGTLIVTDTYNQRLIAVPTDGGAIRYITPLPDARTNDWNDSYHHVNAILQVGDQVLLLLHNGATPERRSAIVAFDQNWRKLWSKKLPGPGCHDLVLDSEGTLFCCNSMAGAVMASNGRQVKVSDMMTRGLCVQGTDLVVGSTQHAARQNRDQASGLVSFLSIDQQEQCDVPLPSGPTAIKRCDGMDVSPQTMAPLDPSLLRFDKAHRPAPSLGRRGAE